MRGYFDNRFGKLEIITILGTFLFLPRNQFGNDMGILPEKIAQLAQQGRILAKLFDQNVTRAIQHRLDIRKPGLSVKVIFGFRFRRQCRIVIQCIGQWLQTGFARNLGPRATFGFVWQIQIFKRCFGRRLTNLPFQCRGQFFLLGDTLQNDGTAILQLTQIQQPFLQFTQLYVVQSASHLFAVTGDKWHRCAVIQQCNGSGNLLCSGANFVCYLVKHY